MEDKVKDERITITFVSGLCLFKNFSFLSNRVFMASKLIMLSVIILLLFDSCVSRSDYNTISSKCDSLQIEMEHKKEMNSDYSITIGLLRDSITILKDSIMRLSYPADQRYHHILNLIQVDSLDLAAIEIENLKSLFPLSKETENIHVQEELINTRRTEIKKRARSN